MYAMKCVGYDTQFQVVLARNYKKFSPPKPKSKSKGVSRAAQGRKRNPATPEASDLGVDVKSESGESEEDERGEDDVGASTVEGISRGQHGRAPNPTLNG